MSRATARPVNVLDLIDLLLALGQPPVEGWEETSIVNVLDLIDVLVAFGTACP